MTKFTFLKENPKKRKLETSTIIQKEDVYKLSPLSVVVSVASKGEEIVKFRVFFLETLQIVAAVTLSQSKSLKTKGELLSSLFENDRGVFSPNPSNQVLFGDQNTQSFEYDETKANNARPFKWLQLFCGLEFLNNEQISSVKEFDGTVETFSNRILELVY